MPAKGLARLIFVIDDENFAPADQAVVVFLGHAQPQGGISKFSAIRVERD